MQTAADRAVAIRGPGRLPNELRASISRSFVTADAAEPAHKARGRSPSPRSMLSARSRSPAALAVLTGWSARGRKWKASSDRALERAQAHLGSSCRRGLEATSLPPQVARRHTQS